MIFTEHFSKDQRLSAHKPCTCFWETCSSNRFSTGVCPWKLSRFFAVLRYVWYMKFVLITESPNQSSSRNEDGTFFPAKNCPSQGIENSRLWFLGQRFLKWAPLVGVRIPGGFCRERGPGGTENALQPEPLKICRRGRRRQRAPPWGPHFNACLSDCGGLEITGKPCYQWRRLQTV